MHQLIRLTLASIISGIIGWLLMTLINGGYTLITGHSASPIGGFTFFNWCISAAVSAVVFVYVYIKITNLIES